MSSFENNIKDWVSLDNKIKAKQDEMRVLREKKSEITNMLNKINKKFNILFLVKSLVIAIYILII